ncbi:MAG: DUF2970 domain-containing protein [Alcanivoracaceae bacterium]|jgi:uncharacterized membrane protein YidH (DUF202 family)|nr:DUF2970 domain-containing protein [Alcanivoracaceae bacterium]
MSDDPRDPQSPATPPENSDNDTAGQPRKTSLVEVVQGVLASLIGVQSAKNRERDFKRGDPGDYIAVYVLLVIGLVIGMIALVSSVLDAAGK